MARDLQEPGPSLAALSASEQRSAAETPGAVLVIDDDPLVRQTIVGQVRRLGMPAFAVDPELDIFQAVTDFTSAVIILDLALGNTDAVEVLRGLAQRNYAGGVLLVSGRDQKILEQVRDIGVRQDLKMLPPLMKPIRSGDLAEALKESNASDQSEQPLVLFDLQEALDKHWLELWYQPKVRLDNRLLCGAEGLLRLRHPELGIISPASFIPSAIGDAYEQMTAFVIDAAARDWRKLGSLGLEHKLCLNASIGMIERPSFVQMIRDAWPDAARRPTVVIEVTEDDAITDLALAKEIATQLKLYDVEISVDDFGAGYSSFSRLRDLPFSELKLDRSFVTGCTHDSQKRAVCEATVALAKQFGVASVAEGIETREDLDTITATGFDMAQGYLFARPAPFAEFHNLINTLRSQGTRKKAG